MMLFFGFENFFIFWGVFSIAKEKEIQRDKNNPLHQKKKNNKEKQTHTPKYPPYPISQTPPSPPPHPKKKTRMPH
jgi:hypothetical protein